MRQLPGILNRSASNQYQLSFRSKPGVREPTPASQLAAPHNPGQGFKDVPNTIADAASEAYACYSIRSYRAAILLARSVVEAAAKDQGVTKGNLATKIYTLADKRLVSPLVAQQAHEIRHIGNEMAHGDFIQNITEEECDDVLNFMSVLLDALFQQPAKLTRHQEQRQRRKTEGRT